MNTAVFYLWDAGKGYIIDADPSTSMAPPNEAVTNNAFSGTFTTQATSFNVSGNTLALFGGSAIPDIPNIDAAVTVNSAASTYSATGDLTSLDSQVGNSPGISFDGTISITDPILGHGSATFPAGVFGDFMLNQPLPATFYIIAPNQFVLIGVQSGVNSGVAFFDSQ
jgi:hypothetical protein